MMLPGLTYKLFMNSFSASPQPLTQTPNSLTATLRMISFLDC